MTTWRSAILALSLLCVKLWKPGMRLFFVCVPGSTHDTTVRQDTTLSFVCSFLFFLYAPYLYFRQLINNDPDTRGTRSSLNTQPGCEIKGKFYFQGGGIRKEERDAQTRAQQESQEPFECSQESGPLFWNPSHMVVAVARTGLGWLIVAAESRIQWRKGEGGTCGRRTR